VGDRTNFSSVKSSFSRASWFSGGLSQQKVTIELNGRFGDVGKIWDDREPRWALLVSFYRLEKREAMRFCRPQRKAVIHWKMLNGIERLSIFSRMDEDDNGLVDSFGHAVMGPFALNKLRGLWVEYQISP